MTLLFLFFSLLFLFSATMFLRDVVQAEQEQAAFDDLTQLVEEAGSEQTPDTEIPPAALPDNPLTGTIPPELPQYTEYMAVYEENNDFSGWLHIDNTKIDYPVMLTPDEPEYYLRRAFDKSSAQSGTPFIGAGGDTDSDLFIIYGHNMQNDTMFGTLDNYADKSFWENNKTFTFATVCDKREYEVFAAIKTRILQADETGFRYYNMAGELTQDEFQELTDWLLDKALYRTEIVPAYGEQIVILSTCAYHTDNGRFIVAARRITDKENGR